MSDIASQIAPPSDYSDEALIYNTAGSLRKVVSEIERLNAEVARMREAYREMARAALAVSRPVIMEECARVAEDYDGPGMVGGYDRHLGDGYETRRDIAAAIRALKDT